jgi:hypothetical protein
MPTRPKSPELMTKKRNESSKYNKIHKERLSKNLGSLWENEPTFNIQNDEKYSQSKSFSNIHEGRYVKKLPKDRDHSRHSRDISPTILVPPNIEALKQKVRDQIRTLDTLKF